jgi:AcrR family transcriptional regulator
MSDHSYCLLAFDNETFQVAPTTVKARTNPRKSASQQRSRLTVDALLEATARILVKDGYDRASTNKIAQAAGVSIGSLYQYFPSKEALVAAVIDRHAGEMMQLVREALDQVVAWPPARALPALVRVMIDAHRVNPRLHRALFEQVPRVGRLDNIQSIDREAAVRVRAYLEAHRHQISVADTEQAAFFCVTTVEALTHAAIVHRPEVLGDGEVESYIGEISRMLLGYLGARRARR